MVTRHRVAIGRHIHSRKLWREPTPQTSSPGSLASASRRTGDKAEVLRERLTAHVDTAIFLTEHDLAHGRDTASTRARLDRLKAARADLIAAWDADASATTAREKRGRIPAARLAP